MESAEAAKLEIYISGRTPGNALIVEGTKSLVQESRPGKCEVEVIDILEDPEAALRENISVTPTLRRVRPGPPKQVMGYFSKRNYLIAGLTALGVFAGEPAAS